MAHKRQLLAIMFTDIVGYTSLMGKDEDAAFDLLHKSREIQQRNIEKYGGSWLKELGDGVLAQFNNAYDAVLCAYNIQQEANTELSGKLRIGIHLGDVTREEGDVFGDGVNIAARLLEIADPGGVYVSEAVRQAIRGRGDIELQYLADTRLKNVDQPIKTYYLSGEGLPTPTSDKIKELVKEGKPFSRTGYLVITTILVGFVLWLGYNNLKQTKYEDIRSLAVLPIENITGSNDNEYLAASLHGVLTGELSRISGIRVISRRSTLAYKKSLKSIPEIAKELGVDGVVEASLLSVGDNLSLQVQLIQAHPIERSIWSQEYDRSMNEAPAMQNEVVLDIASEINVSLTPQEKTRLSHSKKVDPEAYKAYLNGMFHWEELNETGLEKAMQYFELARSIDSTFAPAYAGIAKVWGAKVQQGLISYTEAEPKVKAASQKALSLDSALSDVHFMLAGHSCWWDWNWAGANNGYKKAIEANPNFARARAYYSHVLDIIGKPEEADIQAEKSMEIEPFNLLIQGIYAAHLNFRGRYDEAIKILGNVLQADPDNYIAHSTLRSSYHNKHMFDDALKIWESSYAIRKDPQAVETLKQGAKEGGYEMALQRLAELLIARRDTSFVTPWQIGTLYTRAGKKDEALDWLKMAYEAHDSNMPYISIDPIFDYMREDPRFVDILRKMDLLQFQQK